MRLQLTKETKIDVVISILLFVIAFSIYAHFTAGHVGGDGVSMYYPARDLIDHNSLNMWDSYNSQYDTYYFKFPFTDEVILDRGVSYPVQSIMTIFIEAIPIALFGDLGFFYTNPFFGALTVVVCYFTTKEMGCRRISSAIGSMLLTSMPVFIFWSIVPQNIIPSTFLFLVSIYFMLRYRRRGNQLNVALAGLMFGLSVAIRIPNVILILAFVPLFYSRTNRFRFEFRQIGMFVVPIILLMVIVLGLNQAYFGDALFQGYLHSDYHPIPPSEMSSGADNSISGKFFSFDFSPEAIVETTWDIFIGSIWIYCPLFVLFLAGIAIAPKELKRFKYLVLLVVIVAILYYSQISPILFRPGDANLRYSLSVTLFRYLLPVYVVAALGGPFIIEQCLRAVERVGSSRIWRNIGIVAIVLLMITSVSSSGMAYAYKGGASLKWYDEINSKIGEYSINLDGRLEKGAVVLYDNRWVFEMVYPNVTDYHWFFYDGIPPEYRFNHTVEIVNSLLADHRTVYFTHFGPPYDELSRDMERHLNESFLMSPVDGTSFPRLNAVFYTIQPLTIGADPY